MTAMLLHPAGHDILPPHQHDIPRAHIRGRHMCHAGQHGAVSTRRRARRVGRAVIKPLDNDDGGMQLTDSHTTEYIQRLREEPVLLALTSKAGAYLRRIGDTRNLAFLALRETEHFYYKSDTVYAAMCALVAAAKSAPDGAVADPPAEAAPTNGAAPAAPGSGDDGEVFTDPIKLRIPMVRLRATLRAMCCALGNRVGVALERNRRLAAPRVASSPSGDRGRRGDAPRTLSHRV